MTAEKLKQLFTQWKHDGNLVFVTGAGLSTPSGIKDFKTLDASRILSRYYVEGHRDKFHKWVDENLKDDTIQPNEYHLLLEDIDAPVIYTKHRWSTSKHNHASRTTREYFKIQMLLLWRSHRRRLYNASKYKMPRLRSNRCI